MLCFLEKGALYASAAQARVLYYSTCHARTWRLPVPSAAVQWMATQCRRRDALCLALTQTPGAVAVNVENSLIA